MYTISHHAPPRICLQSLEDSQKLPYILGSEHYLHLYLYLCTLYTIGYCYCTIYIFTYYKQKCTPQVIEISVGKSPHWLSKLSVRPRPFLCCACFLARRALNSAARCAPVAPETVLELLISKALLCPVRSFKVVCFCFGSMPALSPR